MVVVRGGGRGEEGGLDVVEPFGEEGVDFRFLFVPGVLNVKVEVPHDEVFARGGGQFREDLGYFGASVPGWEIDGVDGESSGGSPFLDVDRENAAGDNDAPRDDFEAEGDNNGNTAFGAASWGVSSRGVSHVASGEELLPEGGIGVKPVSLGETYDVARERCGHNNRSFLGGGLSVGVD